jgi:hypothetical protein
VNPLFPATPTALPIAPTAQVAIQSSDWRVWAFADDAIMVWHQITPARTQVIQVGIIVVIVIAFAFLGIRWLQSITNKGDL